jgi:prevent-host-death family protein
LPSDPSRVGVREVRQNLSVYLDRVKRGEVLTVTEHGQAVAVLQRPPQEPASALERLVAAGCVIAPTRSLRDLAPPRPVPPGTPPVSQLLDDLRDDRF